MEGEHLPRGQPSHRRPRRLRDISHLYISGRAAAPESSAATARRALRIGFVTDGHGAIKSDVCGNFAVQLARLGQRTLVLELDPGLPNVGFGLGLEPQAYAAHLYDSEPRLERALLGLRVVEGLAGRNVHDLSAAMQQEIAASDCVLVNLPDLQAGAEAALAGLGTLFGSGRETTVAQVAARSPMFNAWFETARRATMTTNAAPRTPLDALVLVHAGPHGDAVAAHFRTLLPWLGPGRVHLLGWGNGNRPAQPLPWAWITPYAPLAQGRKTLSSLFPEHPASRTYEGLVQSLLAGGGGGRNHV